MSLRNPVKYPVKYYSWQDTQAPQLSNADGVIKTILKACLVTGYGTKAGAGWTSLFEDAYRIVLRRPLRTGSPPDIKIENGTITGTTVRHRIVAQDNPTGLDDNNELLGEGLISRSATNGEWHLLATEFAFMLCYPMGGVRSIVYCGEVIKAQDASQSIYILNSQTDNESGNSPSGYSNNTSYLNGGLVRHSNIFSKNRYGQKYIDITQSEMSINQDYIAQNIILGEFEAIYPFFTSLSKTVDGYSTKKISISTRDFLRFVAHGNYYGEISQPRAFYIPLDYWEL